MRYATLASSQGAGNNRTHCCSRFHAREAEHACSSQRGEGGTLPAGHFPSRALFASATVTWAGKVSSIVTASAKKNLTLYCAIVCPAAFGAVSGTRLATPKRLLSLQLHPVQGAATRVFHHDNACGLRAQGYAKQRHVPCSSYHAGLKSTAAATRRKATVIDQLQSHTPTAALRRAFGRCRCAFVPGFTGGLYQVLHLNNQRFRIFVLLTFGLLNF
jgi:hypothetical protein